MDMWAKAATARSIGGSGDPESQANASRRPRRNGAQMSIFDAIATTIAALLCLFFGGDVSKDPPHQDAVKGRK